MAQIKAKGITSAPFASYKNGVGNVSEADSYNAQNVNPQQQQQNPLQYTYTNAPNEGYNSQQVCPPFCSPTILQTWAPTTPACVDLGTVLSVNGLSPQAAFRPLTSNSNRNNSSSRERQRGHRKRGKENCTSGIHKALSSLYEDKEHISEAKVNKISEIAIKEIESFKFSVQSVEKFIQTCPSEYKVAGLYVIDSIVRTSKKLLGSAKDVFGPRFVKNITTTFQHLFKCSEKDRTKIIRVLNVWQKKKLFPNDVIETLLDMGHPNTSKECYNQQMAPPSAMYSNKMHQNMMGSSSSHMPPYSSQSSGHNPQINKKPPRKSSDSWKRSPQNTEESVEGKTHAEMSTKNLEKFNKVKMSNMVIKEDSHLCTQPKALAPSTCRDEPPPFECPAEDCNDEFGKDREPFPDDKQPPNRPSGDRFDDGSQQLIVRKVEVQDETSLRLKEIFGEFTSARLYELISDHLKENGITPQVTSGATQPAPAVTPPAAREYPNPGPQPAQVPYSQPAPYPSYNDAAAYGAQQQFSAAVPQ